MFSFFNKNKETEAPGFNIDGILGMLNPILITQGIDLETMIPNAASHLKLLQEQSGINIVAMIGVNDEGSGFDLGFFEINEAGMNCLSKISVTDVPTAIEQLKSLPDTFAAIIQQKQNQDATTINTAQQDHGQIAGSENNTTTENHAGEPGANEQPGSTGQPGGDQLDQSDAE